MIGLHPLIIDEYEAREAQVADLLARVTALKEVNEQLKAEKIKMATLETKYEELLKRVEDIEAL